MLLNNNSVKWCHLTLISLLFSLDYTMLSGDSQTTTWQYSLRLNQLNRMSKYYHDFIIHFLLKSGSEIPYLMSLSTSITININSFIIHSNHPQFVPIRSILNPHTRSKILKSTPSHHQASLFKSSHLVLSKMNTNTPTSRPIHINWSQITDTSREIEKSCAKTQNHQGFFFTTTSFENFNYFQLVKQLKKQRWKRLNHP